MVLEKHAVTVEGDGPTTLVLAHGYGCDQNMWRPVADKLKGDFRVVLFDYVGFGNSDLSAYSSERYGSLDAYAGDVVAIGRELGLEDAVFVGHSVSAMIGALASLEAPGMFGRIVMVGPSPYYLKDGDYDGGFTADAIAEMLDFLGDNHFGWSEAMAPQIMGNPDRPELGEALSKSFCATDPQVARDFARVTFLSDTRDVLGRVTAPTLVLQCRNDMIAPENVGRYVSDTLPDARYQGLEATGHCPNLSAPDEVAAAIRAFVGTAPPAGARPEPALA